MFRAACVVPATPVRIRFSRLTRDGDTKTIGYNIRITRQEIGEIPQGDAFRKSEIPKPLRKK